MPFDALHPDAPVTPDLTEPSPEALAYILRNKELWPTPFRQQGWDFRHGRSCAVGLCYDVWGIAIVDVESLHPAVNRGVFSCHYWGPWAPHVTPEQVAAAILDK